MALYNSLIHQPLIDTLNTVEKINNAADIYIEQLADIVSRFHRQGLKITLAAQKSLLEDLDKVDGNLVFLIQAFEHWEMHTKLSEGTKASLRTWINYSLEQAQKIKSELGQYRQEIKAVRPKF